MRIISLKPLKEHGDKFPDAKSSLDAWAQEAKNAQWKTPADIKATYGHATILKGGRVVFNINGNHHRLVVWINYDFATIYIRFIGTHKEYDAIDAETI